MSERLRLFLAIDPSPAARAALTALQDRLRDAAPGFRWLDPATFHVTVKFLGDVDAAHRPAIEEIAAAAAQSTPAVTVAFEGVRAFPRRRDARVLVAALSAPSALARLAASLDTAFVDLGVPAEGRAFRPHVTLARRRPGAAPPFPEVALDAPLPGFAADRLRLYRSRLSPAGAAYDELAAWPLRG